MDASNSKRKKRKTRKCLDKIRKRSRLFNNYDTIITGDINQNKDIKMSAILNVPDKKKNILATHRLTLSMFHKAVRSETITRPILSEISHVPFRNSNNMVNGKIGLQDDIGSKPILINSDSSHSSNQNDMKYIGFDSYNGMKRIHRNGCNSVNNYGGGSPDSFMFSPLNQSVETEVFEESSHEDIPQLNNSFLHSIQESYNLYEKVINEIPKFVKENALVLLQEDTMVKTRTLLHKVLIEQQYQDIKLCHVRHSSEDDDVSCISHSPMTTIVQNPVDYIRLGQVWEKSTHSISSGTSCSSGTPLSSMPPFSPRDCQIPFVPCAIAPCSPLISCSPLTPVSPLVMSVIRDSPEYNYYPHKLNQ